MRFDIDGEAAGDVDIGSLSDGSSEAFLLRLDMLCTLNGGSERWDHMLAMSLGDPVMKLKDMRSSRRAHRIEKERGGCL